MIEDEFDYSEELEFLFEEDSSIDIEEDEGLTTPDKSIEEDDSLRSKKNYKQWNLTEFIDNKFVNPCRGLQQLQLPQCDFDSLLIMLHYCKWQCDEVINHYYDGGDRFKRECGISSEKPLRQRLRDYFCNICCNEFDEVDVYSLSCNHQCCIRCYGEYVNVSSSQGKLIRCFEANCSLTVPHNEVTMLFEVIGMKPSSDWCNNPLLIAAAKVYVEAKKSNFKWCPAPDCNTLVEMMDKIDPSQLDQLDDINISNESIDISQVPIVTCPSNHEFCYGCQYENHLPCPCWIVKLWVRKCQDDSETANWLQANTHSCPRCDSQIEKNGGCNHMTCPTCKYEFCWICLKEWLIHGTAYYKCNKFDQAEKDTIEENQRLKRLSLQRYLHYYKHFSVHESSMKGDIRTLATVNDKMRIFMEEQLKKNTTISSWIDIQFLQDAFKALTHGRKTLKWSYCFGFYLTKTNYGDVFESMQEFLNKVVEDLSKIFEEINHKKNKSNSTKLIMNHKLEIINLSNLVVKRQNSLIDCAKSGLQQHLLVFETI